MKGQAHELLRQLQQRHAHEPFRLAAMILKARLVPKVVTPELDDPDLERRLFTLLHEPPPSSR